MARIRTVKPEFWTDKKISELSHSAALFFIGTWNFCDDEGKFILDAKQMSLRMPIFRSKDILGWFSELSELGLIQVSEDSEWGLVTNWKHQKINRPIPVKIKAEEIQWLPIGHSLNKPDSSVNKQRKDRIGKEGIGKDRKGAMGAKTAKQKPPVLPIEKSGPANDLYKELWKQKYGAEAPFGGKEAGQISTLVKSYGLEKTKQYIEAFLQMNDQWFLTKRHDLGSLTTNLNAVAQFIETGRMFTKKEIQNADSSQATRNMLDAIDRGEI